jgi:uncharacterized protein
VQLSCTTADGTSYEDAPDRATGQVTLAASRVTRHAIACGMTVRRPTPESFKGVLQVDWALFGELSRALALRVAREYDPEIVLGVATAGVVPGAVIAAILDREFHSILVSRKLRSSSEREEPAVLSAPPEFVEGRRVLIVDETCDSGETLRLAVATVVAAGALEVRTAVGFRTGEFQPDFHALATESEIVLPWDTEVLVDGELQPNPRYE